MPRKPLDANSPVDAIGLRKRWLRKMMRHGSGNCRPEGGATGGSGSARNVTRMGRDNGRFAAYSRLRLTGCRRKPVRR